MIRFGKIHYMHLLKKLYYLNIFIYYICTQTFLANCLNELCLIDKKSAFRCPNITALNDRRFSCPCPVAKQFIREEMLLQDGGEVILIKVYEAYGF